MRKESFVSRVWVLRRKAGSSDCGPWSVHVRRSRWTKQALLVCREGPLSFNRPTI